MPFGRYGSFDDCTKEHSDKDDPEAYCASIERAIKGEMENDAGVGRRDIIRAMDAHSEEMVADVASGWFAQAEFQQGDLPDNAVNISDPSEAPEDATVVEGPRGGTYYIPADEDGGEDGGGGAGPDDDVFGAREGFREDAREGRLDMDPETPMEAAIATMPTADEDRQREVAEAVAELPEGASEEQVADTLDGLGLDNAEAVAPGFQDFAGSADEGGDEGVGQAPSPENVTGALDDMDDTRVEDIGESLGVSGPADDPTEVASNMGDEARQAFAEGDVMGAIAAEDGTPTQTLVAEDLVGQDQDTIAEAAEIAGVDMRHRYLTGDPSDIAASMDDEERDEYLDLVTDEGADQQAATDGGAAVDDGVDVRIRNLSQEAVDAIERKYHAAVEVLDGKATDGGTASGVDQQRPVYVDSPADAPEGAQVKSGERGGTFYDTEDVEEFHEEMEALNERVRESSDFTDEQWGEAEQLRDEYEAVSDDLFEGVISAAGIDEGVKASHRVKSAPSMLEKAFDREDASAESLDELGDVFGARIEPGSVDEVRTATENIRENLDERLGVESVEVDNRLDPEDDTYYRSVHIDFETEDGFKGEIQVESDDMAEIIHVGHETVYKNNAGVSDETLDEVDDCLTAMMDDLFGEPVDPDSACTDDARGVIQEVAG